MMKMLFTPLNISLAFISSYFTAKSPFQALAWVQIIHITVASYSILYLAQNFPAKEDIGMGTFIHVSVVALIMNLISTFDMVAQFGFIMSITDKRIAGIHVTFMACMYNFQETLHKLYVFRLIDTFGIFLPQIVMTAVGLTAWVLFRSRLVALQTTKRESWHVASSTLEKRQH